MADDPFRSPKQRLASAKRKIAELNAAIESFVKSEPYACVIDIEPGSGLELHKIKMAAPIPDLIVDLTMEIIEAVRSALDQAGFACAVLAGKPNAKSAYFPFADAGPELATVIKGRCKDLPADIVTLFRSYMPYQGGNDPLWAMNKLRQGTHTVLVPIGTASGGFTITHGIVRAIPAGGNFSIGTPMWDSAKNEMIFARVTPGTEFNFNFKFAFYIAFGQRTPYAGAPILAALDHLQGMVAGILAATEAECRRIGLLK